MTRAHDRIAQAEQELAEAVTKDADPVNHPQHYTDHPAGVECIEITEHMNFCLGNATKYIWRAGLKSADPSEDLLKARWYINRELGRLAAVHAASTWGSAERGEQDDA